MTRLIRPPAPRRPAVQYVLLSLMFVGAVLYQIRYSHDIIRDEKVSVPFFATQDASPVINLVDPPAIAAGLRRGDILIAVNGRPYTGTAVRAEEIAGARPGVPIAVTVQSSDGSNKTQHTLQLPVTWSNASAVNLIYDFLLQIFLPLFCILLGFWVAAVRPRDPLAWLLLGLLLSFPNILEAHKIESWGPGLRELAMIYHAGLGYAWPVLMYFFGKLFPEEFPPQSTWRKIWRALFWLAVIPDIALGLPQLVVKVGGIAGYSRVMPIYLWLQHLAWVAQAMAYILVSSFFAAIGIKSSFATLDAQRRLRVLYWGTSIAMTPALVIGIAGMLSEKSGAHPLPEWLVAIGLSLLLLFPVALAYVIVVQRAMDVRLVVRTGLQYALAKNGVRVLQVVLTAIFIIATVNLASDVNRNRPQKIQTISLGILAVALMQRGAGKLRSWTDRRFFREAYDAELILSDLSESVRSFVEIHPLLETVAQRISESLHVTRVAVMLNGSGMYRPAFALGYPTVPEVVFPDDASTVTRLRENREPARVYLDDPDSWVYRKPEANEEERSNLAILQSELLLPLAVRDKLLGFISLGHKLSEQPYSGSDVRLLQSVAGQTGLALENARLVSAIAEEVAQRERLNMEVAIAREVQERLFPQKFPAIAGLAYAGACRPALGVGGDYYDFLALPGGQLGIALGDVSGKGIAAALMMASLQASLRGEVSRGSGNLAAIVGNVNQMVFEVSSANRYATFFYAQYNPALRKLTYVNAGHNPPLLFHRADAGIEVSRLETGGTVVGLLESFAYQQGEISMSPGDTLIAFTDGISEAMNNVDEEWSEEKLMETVMRCAELDPSEMIARIMQEADGFVAGAKQYDDMTLVILRALA